MPGWSIRISRHRREDACRFGVVLLDEKNLRSFVIPEKAGIQWLGNVNFTQLLDPRMRGELARAFVPVPCQDY